MIYLSLPGNTNVELPMILPYEWTVEAEYSGPEYVLDEPAKGVSHKAAASRLTLEHTNATTSFFLLLQTFFSRWSRSLGSPASYPWLM